MFKFKNLLLLTIAIFTAFSFAFAGCSAPAPKEEPKPAETQKAEAPKEESKSESVKVAMVMPGPINDAGWNQSAYEGLQEIKVKYNAEVAYTENAPQPDFETIIRDYADKGFDLIICHGFEFSDPVKVVAPSFPNSTFAVVNGDSFQEPNMSSFRFNTPETGFLAGAVAGLVTKVNSVAIVGGTKIPNIVDAVSSYQDGAKYVNPNVEVQTGYTETMTDVPKGKEMAITMIEKGADVIVANANQVGLGVIDAAKTKGITALGYVNDQYNVAPDTVLVSVIQDVRSLIMSIADKMMSGEMVAGVHLSGSKEGVIRLSDWHGNESKLPAGAMDKINEVYEAIKDGSLKEKGILSKSVFEK